MGFAIFNPAQPISVINRNFFKNPAFAVVQEAASGVVPVNTNLPTAALGYPGETEWCLASLSVSCGYSFSGGTLRLTPSTAQTHYIIQRIESVDASRLAGKIITLSAELSGNEGSVNFQLFRPTIMPDAHGTIASPTQILVFDSGLIELNSILTRYSRTVVLPVESILGLEVRFVVNTTGGTTAVEFARPKLEEGSSPTTFTCDDYAVELVKCERYFRKMTDFLYTYMVSTGTMISERHHFGMFSTTRIRKLYSQNSISGTGVSISAGVNENSTKSFYQNNAGAGYWGGNPFYAISAHIP